VADAVFAWASFDPGVAQVDQSGLVTGSSIGSTRVRVVTEGGAAEADVTVM
jgi:hypothetical protein